MKKSKLVLTILIFMTLPRAWALELRQYCFDRSVSLERVKIYLSQITLDKDIINLNHDPHCISIGVDESRSELFQRYLSMNYKFTESGNSQVSKKECLFEVETIKSSQKVSSKVKFGQKIHLGNSTSSSEGKTISKIRVMERKLAQIYVNESLVTVSCNIRGKVTSVDISLADKKTSLSTSIELTKGQRVNLSNVVEDLSNESSDVSISGQASFKRVSGSKKNDVFLILK